MVDDEKLIRELLADNIERIPFLHLVSSCKNAMEALSALHAEKIDLMFLDIRMPDLDGISLLRSLKHRPQVILVTAYKDYAWEGFDLDVTDYLVKPFSFERFLRACNKLMSSLQNRAQSGRKPVQSRYQVTFSCMWSITGCGLIWMISCISKG